MTAGKKSFLFSLIGIGIAVVAAYYGYNYYSKRQYIEPQALNGVAALDRENRNATFVFVNPRLAKQISHNKVILLDPIGDDLRIDFDKYVHKGHDGPLYIILPDRYAGPKEKMILKSFPGYKGWYGSMLSANFVIYAAK
jgi:hypothetical protein